MLILLVSNSTLTEFSCTECEKLLVFSRNKGMHTSTCNVLNSFVGETFNSLGDRLELSIAMTTLAFILLWCLSTTPGVQVTVDIDSSCMIVTTGDLHHLDLIEPWYSRRFIRIIWNSSFIHHICSSKLED